MYLTDKEIRARLPDLDIVTDPDIPFNSATQIQAYSIDLRLSNVYWRYAGRGNVDLRMSQFRELNPRRHWVRHELARGESITLKPLESCSRKNLRALYDAS
jgi:deoxycytidine triphosphate deaminase